jgi:hypothetical protein
MIWSLRTTPNSSTGYTPFFLLFGAKEYSLPTFVTVHLVWEHMSKKMRRRHSKTPKVC